MGEVYRAKDPRLGREVAIKVLPASFSADGDRLRRFEQEARAAGILNHPNITAVYDVGSDEAGAPYVVSELLEGETLRARMSGEALSPRKALEYALQIAHGLAAAHEKGIVHRDLKPENLFITKDGRVKILDFGLASWRPLDAAGRDQTAAAHDPMAKNHLTALPTMEAPLTEPGMVLGTLGYMSPEQVRGRPADPCSDIFSFGAILYEMLSGRRAFHGDSAADTMSAILREDPPDLSVTNQNVSPGLERVVRHCLEKNPEQRFHSAHDLAFDLESLSGVSAPRVGAGTEATRRSMRIPGALAATLLAIAAGVAIGHFVWRPAAAASPTFRRLTFRRGNIGTARFTPDGQRLVFAAAWESNPVELFSAPLDRPESVPIGFKNADLLAVSSTSELALSIREMELKGGGSGSGTLARAPLGGGAPREVLEFVNRADWTPDGQRLAIVRAVGGTERIELPIGKVIYSTGTSAIYGLRVSPTGDRIAFLEGGGDRGTVNVVDLAGIKKTLTGPLRPNRLAWAPSGKEIWFDSKGSAGDSSLEAVDLSGKSRILLRAPANLILHDVSKDGRILVERYAGGSGILYRGRGAPGDRELGWFDRSNAADISADGSLILFNESGDAAGGRSMVYVRKGDGSPAVKLADGRGFSLSGDGKMVLVRHPAPDDGLALVPTGSGVAVEMDRAGLNGVSNAELFPDGTRVLLGASLPGKARRLYVQPIPAGAPRAISPDGFDWSGHPISPDGKWVIAYRDWSENLWLFPVAEGAARPIPNTTKLDPIRWAPDSTHVLVAESGSLPARIHLLDVVTGTRTFVREIAPADPLNAIHIRTPAMTADGNAYACSYDRAAISDLFLVSGIR